MRPQRGTDPEVDEIPAGFRNFGKRIATRRLLGTFRVVAK